MSLPQTIVSFSAHRVVYRYLYLIDNNGLSLVSHVPCDIAGADMIIFILTLAVASLFVLTLTGSIASATRRRS